MFNVIYMIVTYSFVAFSCNNEQSNERKELAEKLSQLEEKLNEVETTMRTKQTELMHLESDNMRLLQEKQSAKIELDNCSAFIRESNLKITFTCN